MKKKIKSQTRQDVYQMITDIILEKLEKGVIPWKQRWNTQGPAANYLTKKPYRGINALLLNSIGFTHPYFLTFKQTQQLGGKVKKGSKSLPVVYWQWNFYHKATGCKLTEEDAKVLPNAEVEQKAFLRYYPVFNIQDIEGIKLNAPSKNLLILNDEDKLFKGFQPLHTMPHPVATKPKATHLSTTQNGTTLTCQV